MIRFYEAADEVWIPQAAVEETLREYGYKGRIEVVDNGNDFAGTPFLQSVRQEARRTLGIRSGEFMFLLSVNIFGRKISVFARFACPFV